MPQCALFDLTSGPTRHAGEMQVSTLVGKGYTDSNQAWVSLLMLLPFKLHFDREIKHKWAHSIGLWEREIAYGAYFIAANAEKAPGRNVIIWFSSDVYWTAVADMILCDLWKQSHMKG